MLRSSSMLPSLLAILAIRTLFVGPLGALAQSTSAVCEPSFSWMDNTKGQSPCLVAAYLGGACISTTFTVGALTIPGDYYLGPSASGQDPCLCSSVMYNTVSACALCQNGTVINWSKWDFNCSAVFPGVFTPGIPVGTAVPQWAFQDVTTSDAFNVALALSVGDLPESTATHSQSTGSSSASSTVGSASLTSQPQATATSTVTSSSASGSSSNIPAIVGGVVGGVVGLLLIVGASILFVMKRKPTRAVPQFQPAFPGAAYADDPTAGPPDIKA